MTFLPPDLAQAVRTAAAQKKMLVIMVCRDACTECREMVARMQAPAFAPLIDSKSVVVRLDADRDIAAWTPYARLNGGLINAPLPLMVWINPFDPKQVPPSPSTYLLRTVGNISGGSFLIFLRGVNARFTPPV